MNPPFRIPRSRASQTQQAMRAEILEALAPLLFGDYRRSYQVREELESAFAEAVGAGHAVAVHSGTLGLYLALRACGIDAGDEVITVANSDISTTGAISQCGATPVLCDVLADDYTINPALVEALVSRRTRAILPVDLHGHPANVKALRPIADKHGLKIIEDAALATGARDHGAPLGKFADATMYSFAPFKPLGSAGNGAMLVTDDAAIEARLRLLVGYGYNPQADIPPGQQDYSAEGYNAPLDGLQAAIVLVKLPRLSEWTARRRAIVSMLEAGLAESGAITPVFRAESAPTFRSYAIRSPRQAQLHRELRAAGIEAVIHYAPPITRYAVYAGGLPGGDRLPVTDMLAEQIVNLPVTPELSDAEVEIMIETTRKLLAEADSA